MNKFDRQFKSSQFLLTGFIIIFFLLISFNVFSLILFHQYSGNSVYECVKVYTYQQVNGDNFITHKRVDLRPKNGGSVETFNCDDSIVVGIYNSATFYAQFQPGRYYQVEYIGYRREGLFPMFPMISSVKEVGLHN